jgi:hypothetical protein
MKNFFLALVALLLILQSAIADQLPLVHTESLPLKISRIVRKDDLFAEFKGTIWVTGSLIVERRGSGNDEPEDLLIPDQASRKRLPHFARYGVQWIDVTNGKDAFQRADGAIVAVRGTDQEVRFEKITGAFKISNYVVGVKCDSPWARAIILQVNISNQNLVAALNSPERC